MSTSMTLNFETKYDGKGVAGFKGGMADVEKSLDKVEGSSDRLVSKLERPIGRIAYAGMAESALSAAGANEKLSGTTAALHNTFHILGQSLLFVQPELGLMVIGATALLTVFEKLSAATTLNAENIKKNIEELKKSRDEYKQSAELLLKQGVINKDQAEIIKEASKAKEGELQKVRESIKAKLDELQIDIDRQKRSEALYASQGALNGVTGSSVIMTKRLHEMTLAYTALLPDAVEKQNKQTKAVEEHWKALGEQYTAQAHVLELEKQKRDFDGIDSKIMDDMIAQEKELTGLTLKLNNTKSESDRAELQAHIDYLNRRISADKAILTTEKSNLEQRAKIFAKYDALIADEWLKSNHNMLTVGKAILGQMIKDVADTFATKLEIMAAADLFINPAQAALEIGAAAAVRTIGGGLASDLGGSSGGSSPAAGGGGLSSPSSSSPSSSGTGQMPGTNVTFVLQGIHTLDDNFMSAFLTRQNNFVQSSNGQVIATQVVTQTGTVVAAS